MNVRLIVEGSQEEKDVLKSKGVFIVEQANARAVIDQKSFCRVRGNLVQAIVPACTPTVTSQFPAEDLDKLAMCYQVCLAAAASAGSSVIVIRPLGVGIKMTTMSSVTGIERQNGLWGNLFWSQAKTAVAARRAVDEACKSLPGDVEAVFVVPKESFQDWDSEMQF
jgi:hypothetical protein